jgi:hypothetical protein
MPVDQAKATVRQEVAAATREIVRRVVDQASVRVAEIVRELQAHHVLS